MLSFKIFTLLLVYQTLASPIISEGREIQMPAQQKSNSIIKSQNLGYGYETSTYYRIAASGDTKTQPKTSDPELTSKETSKQLSETTEYTDILGHKIKITDGLLVLFTGFLVVCTGGLIWVGWKQDATTKQQNRAFIGIQSVQLTDKGVVWGNNIQPDQIIEADYRNLGAYLVIKNSGGTPAHNVRNFVTVDVRRAEDERLIVPPSEIPKQSMTAIPPGGIITKSASRLARITAEEIEAIKVCSSYIYVCGTIHYTDAFGKDRITNFKLKWAGNYPFNPSTGGVFCDDGNEAT